MVKSQKNTTSNLVLSWLKSKENRKELYNAWWELHSVPCWPFSEEVGIKYTGRMDDGKYILALKQVFKREGNNTPIFLWHWKKAFVIYQRKYYQKIRPKKILKNGGKTPQVKKTTALYTFLSRGFVHESDFNWEPTKYYVKCNIVSLWYPEGFNSHQDALKMAERIGIPGHTGCPLAGKKHY